MAPLLACPFCRSLYRSDEGTTCRDCGVLLVPMQALGPSHEADPEDALELLLPEDEPLDWHFLGRGRGALLVLSLLGLGAFFCPWVEIIVPESVIRSGFDLARGRAGWLWGGAVGYFVLLPLVWTRRTIARMRGARVATTLLAAMTLGEVAMLLSFPPSPRGLVPLQIEWRWGLYLSGLISAAATVVAARFGGALPPLPSEVAARPSNDARRPAGETLH